MKIGEMRSMSLGEAKKHVSNLRTELAKERAVAAGGTRPENPGKIRSLRKDIARFLTIINQKYKAGEKDVLPEKKEKVEEKQDVKKEIAKKQPVKTKKKQAKKKVAKKKIKKKAGKKEVKRK